MQRLLKEKIALLGLSVLVVFVPAARSALAIDRNSFPGPNNTGVPKGTELTPYTGPCGITEPNTVIDSKRVTCDLYIKAPGVRITRSTTSRIDVDTPGASLTIEDSVINAGSWQSAALGYSNVIVRRVEVKGGGQASIVRRTASLRIPGCMTNTCSLDSRNTSAAMRPLVGVMSRFVTTR